MGIPRVPSIYIFHDSRNSMTKTDFLQLPNYISKPILDKAYWLCDKGYAAGDPIIASDSNL